MGSFLSLLKLKVYFWHDPLCEDHLPKKTTFVWSHVWSPYKGLTVQQKIYEFDKNLQKHNIYTTKNLRKKRTPTKDLMGWHSDVLNSSQILDKHLEQKCGQKAWFVRNCF